jgi:hypothetical protein
MHANHPNVLFDGYGETDKWAHSDLARTNISLVTQSQIAATLACFLGKGYCHDVPPAAPAVTDVLSKRLPCNGDR